MNSCLYCHQPVKNKFCGVSCQNLYKSTCKKEFPVNCQKCSKEFIVVEKLHSHPEREKYFCSRSCANSRSHSAQTKNKTSFSLKMFHNSIGKENIKKECLECNVVFEKPYYRIQQIYCSRSCAVTHRNKTTNLAQSAGLASAANRIKRSKNEIYFFELCKAHFTNVEHNAPIFSGWDADIIIHDIKTAVLWNGKWHYEKITKSHSVKQVQNRDKIKLVEIHKAGYSAYTVKDMGKFNKGFVEAEFEKFLEKQKG